MQDAIELHLQGMLEDQMPIPAPRSYVEYITVPMQ
jgi:predicted RNase H-like HicB family nuclease